MSSVKSPAYEAAILNLLFCAKGISNIADNTATAPLTNLWVALHTGDPSTGNQTTLEGGYTAYTRIATTRTTVGWVVTQGSSTAPSSISPVAAVTFPQCATTTTGTFTYASVGSTSAGTGSIYYSGAISPTINWGNGVTPQISTGSSITEL